LVKNGGNSTGSGLILKPSTAPISGGDLITLLAFGMNVVHCTSPVLVAQSLQFFLRLMFVSGAPLPSYPSDLVLMFGKTRIYDFLSLQWLSGQDQTCFELVFKVLYKSCTNQQDDSY
jgi:hypothetical protein